MNPPKWLAVGLSLACAWALALAADPPRPQPPGVVVVLAGGGAKGFAHLAVLRQLEQDRVPIARIVGTSMGAVIGSLYASGMNTDEIERVIGGLDPAKVALDQLDRLELPPSVRAYQQQYPINFEFGLSQGELSFARGFSDGQRFTALLQKLFAHLPAELDFNRLRIPLRVVATRYRDGETRVFDRGALHLAVRASMAAPGAFAPVEIDGEVYVDGGLVANVPVEVALREGAERIVASYLGQSKEKVSSSNALVVANHIRKTMPPWCWKCAPWSRPSSRATVATWRGSTVTGRCACSAWGRKKTPAAAPPKRRWTCTRRSPRSTPASPGRT